MVHHQGVEHFFMDFEETVLYCPFLFRNEAFQNWNESKTLSKTLNVFKVHTDIWLLLYMSGDDTRIKI